MAKRDEIRAVQDAWRAYLDLALGFTEASRKQATKAVRKVVGKGGATADQLQAAAEDLVKTGLANRESVARLVRFELDKALGRVGLATAEEVADLTSRVRDLEHRLRVAEAAAHAAGSTADGATSAAGTAATAATAVGTSVPAKKTAPAKKASPPAVAKKAAPTKAAPVQKVAPAQKAVPVRKIAPAKAGPPVPVKKAVAKKAVAKRATGTPSGGAA